MGVPAFFIVQYGKVSDHEHRKVYKSEFSTSSKQSENKFCNAYVPYFGIHNTSMYKKNI